MTNSREAGGMAAPLLFLPGGATSTGWMLNLDLVLWLKLCHIRESTLSWELSKPKLCTAAALPTALLGSAGSRYLGNGPWGTCEKL